MIVKQYLDVIKGTKTQTRRLKDRYQVGKVYSVVPKMYQPSVFYHNDGRVLASQSEIFCEWYGSQNPWVEKMYYDDLIKRALVSRGWSQLQILITDKRHEYLQDITDTDAIAEGIKPAFSFVGYYCEISGHYITAKTPSGVYIGLWDAINTKKGLRWEDNPMVWVYSFEVVK